MPTPFDEFAPVDEPKGGKKTPPKITGGATPRPGLDPVQGNSEPWRWGMFEGEDATRLSEALSPYRGRTINGQSAGPRSESLAHFFQGGNNYTRSAREEILYDEVNRLLAQGIAPDSDQFQAALETFASSPEVQQRIGDLDTYESFQYRGPSTSSSMTPESYKEYLAGLNDPAQVAKFREADAAWRATTEAEGNEGLYGFGNESDFAARQRLLTGGADDFRAWYDQNIASESTARRAALGHAQTLGLSDEYSSANRPNQGWQSLADQLETRVQYQGSLDAFTNDPKAQSRAHQVERRPEGERIEGLRQAWQGTTDPFWGTNITPYQNPAAQQTQSGTAGFWGTAQSYQPPQQQTPSSRTTAQASQPGSANQRPWWGA